MWQATDSAVWQGRDDSRESPEALRVFQTVQQHSAWPTTLGKGDIALIGFASDTFVAFRFFDAAKPGPVAWADALFKAVPGQPIGWRQGLGIMFDDLVAAVCALLVLALGVAVRDRGVLATLFA